MCCLLPDISVSGVHGLCQGQGQQKNPQKMYNLLAMAKSKSSQPNQLSLSGFQKASSSSHTAASALTHVSAPHKGVLLQGNKPQ